MRCFHCGQEIDNNAMNCPYCGASQGAGATMVLDQMHNPYATEPESGRTDALPPEGDAQQSYGCRQQAYQQPYQSPAGWGASTQQPRIHLPTNRSLAKMIFLTLITFGIYGIVIWCKMITELNIAASRHDGKRTMPFFAAVMLGAVSLGIVPVVWEHKLCNRIGEEVRRRGFDYSFSASDMWLWGVLGSFIIIGPFVFCHKLLKCMNMINADFNAKG